MPELEALARVLISGREAHGLSVIALAQRLHMGVEQLKALESADQQHLPEPVFVIAQARRVADALGVEISAQIDALRGSERFMASRASLNTDVFQAAAGRQRSAEVAPAKTKTKTKTKTETKTKTPPEPRATAQQATGKAAPNTPAPINAQAGTRLAWLLLLLGVLAAGAWGWQQRQRAQPALAWALQRGFQLIPSARPPLLPPAEPKLQAPATEAPRPVELRISARQPSWLEVRPAAGGQPLIRGTFVGERSVPLAAGLNLRAGRPDLVLVAVGSAPLKPLGTISEIRWVRFNPPGPTKPAAKAAAKAAPATPQGQLNSATPLPEQPRAGQPKLARPQPPQPKPAITPQPQAPEALPQS